MVNSQREGRWWVPRGRQSRRGWTTVVDHEVVVTGWRTTRVVVTRWTTRVVVTRTAQTAQNNIRTATEGFRQNTG